MAPARRSARCCRGRRRACSPRGSARSRSAACASTASSAPTRPARSARRTRCAPHFPPKACPARCRRERRNARPGSSATPGPATHGSPPPAACAPPTSSARRGTSATTPSRGSARRCTPPVSLAPATRRASPTSACRGSAPEPPRPASPLPTASLLAATARTIPTCSAPWMEPAARAPAASAAPRARPRPSAPPPPRHVHVPEHLRPPHVHRQHRVRRHAGRGGLLHQRPRGHPAAAVTGRRRAHRAPGLGLCAAL